MASFASTAAAAAVFPGCGAGARCGGRCVARASAVAMAPGSTARTHYEVLGVGAGASRGEIKAAYRRLGREVHPDAGGCGDEGFIQLHAAYATLADPDERARYDRATMARPTAARRAPSSPVLVGRSCCAAAPRPSSAALGGRSSPRGTARRTIQLRRPRWRRKRSGPPINWIAVIIRDPIYPAHLGIASLLFFTIRQRSSPSINWTKECAAPEALLRRAVSL